MKKKIAILGSTGSIGKTSLSIFDKNLRNFSIFLLSSKSNYKIICNQIQKYKPNYFVIIDQSIYERVRKKFKRNKTQIKNNFKDINLKKLKIDITISSIVGIAGLEPTI